MELASFIMTAIEDTCRVARWLNYLLFYLFPGFALGIGMMRLSLLSAMFLFDQICDLVADITGEDDIRDEPDIDLFEEDVLDSLTAIELLVALESNFGVSIAPTELEREEMNTLNKIVARTRERM